MHNSNEEILSKLRTLRSHIAVHNLLTQAKRLKFLVVKAGFRPNQARVPAGSPNGGQWVNEGSSTEQSPRLWLVGDRPELPPDVPDREPPTIRERNGWAVRVAKYLAASSPTFAGSVLVEWLVRHGGDRILAYQEPAKTLQELQDAAFALPAGFDVHHIVEQGPARKEGFSEDKIESWEIRLRCLRTGIGKSQVGTRSKTRISVVSRHASFCVDSVGK